MNSPSPQADLMNDFHARHAGVFDPAILEGKCVLFVGCGSVGSYAAALLARSGVRKFRLVDPDCVSAANLSRTTFVARDIGTPKVAALARHLTSICGDLEIDDRAADLRASPDEEIETWIGDADLVFAATDHPPTQARLAALSYHRVPALFAGVYALGLGGEVLWTYPDLTPCYACVLGSVRGANAPPRGHTDYGRATGQLAGEPALGIDILHVTVCAAKIAMALLLNGGGDRLTQILDPSRSVLFVGNEVGWIWREPFETVWAHAARRASCVCRLAAGGSTADLLDGPEMQ